MGNRLKGILIICGVFVVSGLKAQYYGNSFGLRLGNGNDFRTVGLTFNQRVSKALTLEEIVQTNFKQNLTFHSLVEKHEPLLTRRLNYFVGTGVSFGNEAMSDNQWLRKSNATVGIDLITGLELTALKYSISIDYKPNFNIVGRESWYQGQVGISARAVLTSGAEFNKNLRQKEKNKRKQKRIERKDEVKHKIQKLFK